MEPNIDGFVDPISPECGQDSWIDQIAAALCPPVVCSSFSTPIVTDIGNILLQLSEAVAEAKGEAERERAKRISLEKENKEMRLQQFVLAEKTACLEDDSTVYSGYRANGMLPSVFETGLSLSECLSYVGSFSACFHDGVENLVYMSYHKAGLAEVDLTKVDRILQPYDFFSLSLVVFASTSNSVIPPELLPFRLDTLEALVGFRPSSHHSPLHSTSTSLEDHPPRMNLLEALNVQSDSDCERILTVRKCHKLGFKSHIHLRQYFSRFGRVERVVLLPMRAKPKNSIDGRGNRPSSMGFVVMESKETVDKILNFNETRGIHEVKGWPIEVRNFVKPVDKNEASDWSVPAAKNGGMFDDW